MDPNALREALDAHSGQKFYIGEMSDPSEVLMTIYECMTKVPALRDGANIPLVDLFFGLRLREALHCQSCNVVSHKLASHIEYFLIIQATALRALARTGAERHAQDIPLQPFVCWGNPNPRGWDIHSHCG